MDGVGEYRPSGSLGSGLVMVPAIGGLVALVAAWIYAYIDVYSPIVGWISLLFVAGFAFVVALGVGLAGRIAKVRNPTFMAVSGAAIGLFAVYADFAAFLHVAIDRFDPPSIGYVELMLSPGAVWEILGLLAETGWYSIASVDVRGVVLWAFWAIEAIVVVLAASAIPYGMTVDRVFCERCGEWTESRDGLIRLVEPESPHELDRLREGDLSALATLPLAKEGSIVALRVDTQHCESCNQTAYAQVYRTTFTVDKKGEPDESTDELSPVMAIGTDGLARLEARAAEVVDGPDAGRPGDD